MYFLCKTLLLIASLLFFSAGGITQTVITINDSLLIPEGIAVDGRNGDIYISSIAKHKIIKTDSLGNTTDFIVTGQDGYLEGLGLKVDEKHNLLWAVSNIRKGDRFISRIHGFEIATSKVKYYYSQEDTIPHLFNDLVITPDNTLFITDTYFSCIYEYEPMKNHLSIFIPSPLLKYPNGLALSNNNNKLYVASYGLGPLVIDLSNKQVHTLQGYTSKKIAFGLDGLVLVNQQLYGVYNADTTRTTNSLVRYQLSPDGKSITSETIVDAGNNLFFDPTTAAVYKSTILVIANSHLDQYNRNKESTLGIEHLLVPLRILSYRIN